MKLKGISFPEPRPTHAIQERVSPWLPPPPILSLCLWCSHAGRGRSLQGDTGSLAAIGGTWPRSQGPGRARETGGRPGDVREVTESAHCPRARSELGTSTANEPAHPSWHMQALSK